MPPTRRFSFSSCRLARFCSPLSLSLSHCFIHLSALETSGSALRLFESKYRGGRFLSTDVFFLNFWFAVLFPSMLNALVSAVQQLEASLFELFITSLTEEFSHMSGMQCIQEKILSIPVVVVVDGKCKYFPLSNNKCLTCLNVLID